MQTGLKNAAFNNELPVRSKALKWWKEEKDFTQRVLLAQKYYPNYTYNMVEMSSSCIEHIFRKETMN